MKLAPNPAAADKGKRLTNAAKWPTLHATERMVWGTCQGSGKTPYKTIIDLQGPAYKCSCPSRQFPCKHAIGLFLLFAKKETTTASEIPEWVTSWIQTRDDSASKKQTKERTPEQVQKSADNSKKNRLLRLQEMRSGLDDLDIWLGDLLRQGLASVENQPANYWQDMASRMEDAKNKGIATRIKNLRYLPDTTTDWPEAMLFELGDIHLLANAFRQIENLPEALQDEIFQQSGFKVKKEEILKNEGVKDDWIILGQISGEEDNLQFRRVWLQGIRTHKYALLLDFVFGHGGFQQQYITGKSLEAELVFYPGSYPLRAIVKTQKLEDIGGQRLEAHQNIAAFLQTYAAALGANPWVSDFPCFVEGVIPVRDNQELILVDANKQIIPIHQREQLTWSLLSISGGRPISIFGEWTNHQLLPLSVVIDNRIIALS